MNPGQLTRVKTASSGSLKEASRRALQLYRNVLKATPKVKTVFDVDMPLPEMRRAITWHFRKSAHIKDPRIVQHRGRLAGGPKLKFIEAAADVLEGCRDRAPQVLGARLRHPLLDPYQRGKGVQAPLRPFTNLH